MRPIKRIIVHCTATREGQDFSTATIRHWHVHERKWSDIGYHFVVELGGEVVEGRPVVRPGAGVKGHNEDSIHVVYVGGLDVHGRPRDTRTPEQRASLYGLIGDLLAEYPGAAVHGHNEYDNKACPSFDAAADWAAHLSHGRTEGVDCPVCGARLLLGAARE